MFSRQQVRGQVMKRTDSRWWWLLVVSFAVAWQSVTGLSFAEEPLRDTRQPSGNVEEVLGRFVEELVKIAPGSGDFPVSTESPAGPLQPAGEFRISRYETTQELYAAVMNGNPSRWKGPRNSVEMVSPQQARRFCVRLTEVLRAEGRITADEVVRLPTDVEWEYCCRARSGESFCFGSLSESPELLDRYAWHTGNAAGNDPAVGVLQANAFGLYDVHGYLWELVETDHKSDPVPRPITWAMGGSWRDRAELLSADSRIPVPNYASSDAIGFRCVVSATGPGVKNPAVQ